MGKEWDAPWKSGAGMSKPGIGDRATPWPSHTGGKFGGANPTCETCGGRARGKKKCDCDKPEWRVSGKPLDDPSNGLTKELEQKRQFQAWSVGWLSECFRVLQPGGIIKVFGATRMFHRMAAAMDEVGFLLPSGGSLEAWGYGCLTDDAEILTENGWKLGVDVVKGERVACWNPKTGGIHLDAVHEVFCKPYEGDMVVFRNDNTDQLLTPNHRVYKKHRIRKMVNGVRLTTEESDWTVQPAGEINRWNNIRLPLAGIHDGPGIGGEDWARLLAWVWTEGGFDQQPYGVRIYQSSVNMEHVNEIQALLDKVVPDHKCYTRERTYKDRTYTEFCWFFAGDMARRVRAALLEKRPTWELLWGMTQAEKHAFVDAALKGDGSCNRGRWAFYQKHPDDLVWFQTLAHLMNRQGRINFRKRAVGLHMNPQTQLQGRHLRAAVSEHYEGDVWCVRVLTGAFVARRADKVFITGNSGFPKYLNTSKAIDHHLGNERPVIGQSSRGSGPNRVKMANHGKGDTGMGTWDGSGRVFDLTAAGSEEAARFEGYATALKPGWEPFLVGRKPE